MLNPAAPESSLHLGSEALQKLGLPWFFTLNLRPIWVAERCFLLAFTADQEAETFLGT